MPADATRLRQGIAQFAARTMAAAGPLVAAQMRADSRVPIGEGPTRGQLRSSFRPAGSSTGSGSSFRVTIIAPVIQAATTDKGAPNHPIRPRRGKYLTWVGPNGRVYARRVNHPGNPARPWFEMVLRDAARSALPDAARRSA